MQMVDYASEEPPFFRRDEMGSAVHAASLERPVTLMIALEMIGYYDSTPGSQDYPSPAMSWSPMRRKNRPSFVAMKWGARYMQLRLSVQ